MNTESLIKLERIARNLPITDVVMERTEFEHGEIFLAYGQDGNGQYHGVWGCRQWGRPVEFAKGVTEKQVKQALVDDAVDFVALSVEKGLVHGSG